MVEGQDFSDAGPKEKMKLVRQVPHSSRGLKLERGRYLLELSASRPEAGKKKEKQSSRNEVRRRKRSRGNRAKKG